MELQIGLCEGPTGLLAYWSENIVFFNGKEIDDSIKVALYLPWVGIAGIELVWQGDAKDYPTHRRVLGRGRSVGVGKGDAQHGSEIDNVFEP